ncbi:MAG: PilZ domain-containing protein [Spirochaetota bacterium]
MEKRKHVRTELQFPITIKHTLLPAIPFSGKVINISLSGVQLTSSIPLAVGDNIELAFRLNNRQYYDLRSTVCWRTTEGDRMNVYRAGIAFSTPIEITASV